RPRAGRRSSPHAGARARAGRRWGSGSASCGRHASVASMVQSRGGAQYRSRLMADLADRLAARTLELVDIPSESRDEAALAAHVLGVLREGGVDARDAGDTCVLAGASARGDRPLVLLAGHLDTVPAQDNRPGRREGGAVHGLGAADMKGALAVMVELALAGAGGTRERRSRQRQDVAALDLAYLFFGREELP